MSFRPASEVGFTTPTTRFVAPGSVTNGEFGLFEWRMEARRPGARPHFHKTFSESFYIVEGTVRLFNGEKWVDAKAGDFLYVAQGGIHAFRNESDARAQMLILFAPAPPRENYFRELAELLDSGNKLSPEEYTEFLARHDQYMA
jgi:mannose-6-phosphate isomerase-like protein (cupin superfamily)